MNDEEQAHIDNLLARMQSVANQLRKSREAGDVLAARLDMARSDAGETLVAEIEQFLKETK